MHLARTFVLSCLLGWGVGCGQSTPGGSTLMRTGGSGGQATSAGGASGSAGSSASGNGGRGAGGSGGFDASSSGGSTGSDAAVPAAMCEETPRPQAPGGQILELPIVVDWAGKALRHGEPNPTGDGRTITPLNLRFYISAVTLTKADGSGAVAADIVTEAGNVAPYGIHFYVADDAASARLRLRAPTGDYREIEFTFGIEDRCNWGSERNPPLSATSQMTWPHTGYLFLRYEARVESPDGGTGSSKDGGVADAGAPGRIPTAIHMGGLPGLLHAPKIRLPATVSVPARVGAAQRLHLALDEIVAGALTDVPDQRPPGLHAPSQGDELVLGEHLRQTAATRPVFVIAP